MSKNLLPTTIETGLLRLRSEDPPQPKSKRRTSTHTFVVWIILVHLSLAVTTLYWLSGPSSPSRPELPPFYSHVNSPLGICNTKNGRGLSHSGYIGLEGDAKDKPKRSFFWYFEAQNDSENAPVILTVGGGPGTSGMLNPLLTQSHCLITQNGTIHNPNAWSEQFNLLALDHPIGVGFSYGTMVNNSRTAAVDVYDFLQKFFSLYPHLIKNKFVISGGSYGGTYVPHIATVIHEQNRLLALGKGYPGAVHINLESLMLSNPMSDLASHFRWWLHQACYNTNLYNTTTCTELFAVLPSCLDNIQYAYENSTSDNRVAALRTCLPIWSGDTHGTMTENVDKKCDGTPEDCFPAFNWIDGFMNLEKTKEELGVPIQRDFRVLSEAVAAEFIATGDHVQPAYLMYEPLLRDGIRLLHYVGAKDANCGWPGVLSFLKHIHSPYQERFIHAPDIPWPQTPDVIESEASVRVIGEGAGNMTYILVADAGHFVASEQPVLVKKIVEHWVHNRPFM